MNDRVHKIIDKIESSQRNLPETYIYNEGWLLRIVLDWFQTNYNCIHDLSFCNRDIIWFSEALLPSPFLPRYRGDKLSESWTHADGVVGEFIIGENQYGDLSLKENCDFFYVIEAKIYSELSKGTKNANYYNQAARNVGCVLELLKRKELDFKKFKKLGFYVIVPNKQISQLPSLKQFTDKNNIKEIIKRRINEYSYSDDFKDYTWLNQHLDSIIDFIEIKLLDWEGIIEFTKDLDILEFYKKCLLYNKKTKI